MYLFFNETKDDLIRYVNAIISINNSFQALKGYLDNNVEKDAQGHFLDGNAEPLPRFFDEQWGKHLGLILLSIENEFYDYNELFTNSWKALKGRFIEKKNRQIDFTECQRLQTTIVNKVDQMREFYPDSTKFRRTLFESIFDDMVEYRKLWRSFQKASRLEE